MPDRGGDQDDEDDNDVDDSRVNAMKVGCFCDLFCVLLGVFGLK